MAVTEITGEEGATWAGAKDVDPTCFNGAGGRGYVYLDTVAPAPVEMAVIIGLSVGVVVAIALGAVVAWRLGRGWKRKSAKGDTTKTPDSASDVEVASHSSSVDAAPAAQTGGI